MAGIADMNPLLDLWIRARLTELKGVLLHGLANTWGFR